MSSTSWTILALVVYFVAMIGIGLYAFRKTTSHEGYMLADRQLHPFTAALSAGASDMSGWLLMGLPGAIYISGLCEAWIAVGLTVGAWLNWKIVAPRLRSYSVVTQDSITIPTFLENRLHDSSHVLRICSGLVILFFFTFYVSSGMVAGGNVFPGHVWYLLFDGHAHCFRCSGAVYVCGRLFSCFIHRCCAGSSHDDGADRYFHYGGSVLGWFF